MNKKLGREKGQSLVELALVLPLLLLILMGLLDFGRAYYVMVSLNDAAMEGAVYAGFRPSDVDGIKLRAASAAQDAMINLGPESVTVAVASTSGTMALASVGATVSAGAPVTVTVARDFEFLTPLIGDMFAPNGLTLRGQATTAVISTP